MSRGDEGAQRADGPLEALARVEAGRVLLDGHVGEVDKGVGDVLLLCRWMMKKT
jgi:hypothetical protein